MKADGLNLSVLLRRLGVKRDGAGVDLADVVQPVQVVSDASALVPPLLPPCAFAGGTHITTAGTFAAIQLHARSPGGLFIREAGLGSAVAAQMRFGLLARAVLANPTALNRYNMGPTPTVSELQVGEVAVARTTAADTVVRFGTNGRFTVGDWIYVPPGLCFYAEMLTITTQPEWYVVWSEVEGAVPLP